MNKQPGGQQQDGLRTVCPSTQLIHHIPALLPPPITPFDQACHWVSVSLGINILSCQYLRDHRTELRMSCCLTFLAAMLEQVRAISLAERRRWTALTLIIGFFVAKALIERAVSKRDVPSGTTPPHPTPFPALLASPRQVSVTSGYCENVYKKGL